MKQYLLICILAVMSLNSSAQSNGRKASNSSKPLSLVAGVMADVHYNTDLSSGYWERLNFISMGGSGFVRKYLGRHWALELDIYKDVSEKTFGTGIGSYRGYSPYSFQTRTWDIPLLAQYHFGDRNAKLRPFISLGGGYAIYDSYTGSVDTTTGRWPNNNRYVERTKTLSIQVAEGITYRVNDKWQINQYVYYKMIGYTNCRMFGMRFGLAYTIM